VKKGLSVNNVANPLSKEVHLKKCQKIYSGETTYKCGKSFK
jgi:hypothetical protein